MEGYILKKQTNNGLYPLLDQAIHKEWDFIHIIDQILKISMSYK